MTQPTFHRSGFFCLALLGLLNLSACGQLKSEAKYPTGADRAATGSDIYAEAPSIFGQDGLQIFGGKDSGSQSAIGVNSYLWRASLDTISFMPLDNADPFGGTIQTQWYNPPETEGERIKLNVLILSENLKTDALRVRTFNQQRRGGEWVDVQSSEQTARQLENAILKRARQLRVADR